MNALPTLRQHNIAFERVDASRRWVRMECPSCQRAGLRSEDKTLSLNYLNGRANCFRCGWEAKKFIEFLDLFGFRRVTVDQDFTLDKPKEKAFSNDIPTGCVEAWTHPESRSYLSGRGLTKSDTEYFGLGFCAAHGGFPHRVIVPVVDHIGRYRTFVSRTTINEEPKYRYPRGSMISTLLYGLWHHVKRSSSVWLVEGVFDVMHCWPYAIGTFGKHLSSGQINLLRIVGCKTVYLLWDADAWQDTPELYEKAIQKLSCHFLTIPVQLPSDSPTEYSIAELQHLCRGAERGR